MVSLLELLVLKEEYDKGALYLVTAINELSICLQEAMDNDSVSGIRLGPNDPPIHSLMFADDLIICGKADPIDVATIKTFYKIFAEFQDRHQIGTNPPYSSTKQ